MKEAQFVSAAADGRTALVVTMLEDGMDVNATDDHQRTALLKAAKHGHLIRETLPGSRNQACTVRLVEKGGRISSGICLICKH